MAPLTGRDGMAKTNPCAPTCVGCRSEMPRPRSFYGGTGRANPPCAIPACRLPCVGVGVSGLRSQIAPLPCCGERCGGREAFLSTASIPPFHLPVISSGLPGRRCIPPNHSRHLLPLQRPTDGACGGVVSPAGSVSDSLWWWCVVVCGGGAGTRRDIERSIFLRWCSGMV